MTDKLKTELDRALDIISRRVDGLQFDTKSSFAGVKIVARSNLKHYKTIQLALKACQEMQWNYNMDEAPRDNYAIQSRDESGGLLPLTWMPNSLGDTTKGYWAFTYGDCKAPVQKTHDFIPTAWRPLQSKALDELTKLIEGEE